MNGYELSRQWFDFSFENAKRVKPIHTALYFFIVELWNRAGQKDEFGLPAYYAMEATGISSYNTYKSAFDELVLFGVIKVVEKSRNQHTATVIALSIFDEADNKAFDKALAMQLTKRNSSTIQSTVQSTDAIIEPENNTELLNQEPKREGEINSPPVQNDFKEPVETNTKPPKKVAAKKVMQKPTFEMVRDHFFLLKGNFWETEKIRSEATKFLSHYETVGWVVGKAKTPMQNWKTAISGWIERAGEFSNNNTNGNKRNSNKYDDLIAENLAAFAGAGEGNNSATGWHQPATD